MLPSHVLAESTRLTDADQIPQKLLQALDDGAVRGGCPPVLEKLCRRCLSIDPRKRPADGAEILRILDGECETSELVRGVTTSKSSSSSSNNTGGGGGTATTEMVAGNYDTSYVASY